MLQLATVLWQVHDLIGQGMTASTSADGAASYVIRRISTYRFFATQEGWWLAHLWLVWVLGVQATVRPAQRVRVVQWLAVALAVTVGVTWAIRVWLASHGAVSA
jgi:hypothetical protein